MLRMCQPEMDPPTLGHAMQVTFQLNFSTKFTGKIKSILKLAMLHMFCEPETEVTIAACKTCTGHI